MNDLSGFIEMLRAQQYFEPGTSLIVARAPGRLDVMGGIADYSGSLVLQRTIAEATFAAIQITRDPVLEITSLGREPFALPLSNLVPGGVPMDYAEARSLLSGWPAYVAGVFIVLMRERDVVFKQGAKMVISSSVPEGKGVASSAALEVAAMQSVVSAFDIRIPPRDLALLCQKVENLVAGAPCGIMDQMTSVCGESNSLLALLCQPAELQPSVRVPEGISFWGIDSGERHAVSGSDYTSVRTGAFMGYRIMAGKNTNWNGYLANVSPQEFEADYAGRLPEEMSGSEFLERYGAMPDSVTQVQPSRTYKIRGPAAHPIYENHRVLSFRKMLLEPLEETQCVRLGELMYESHDSYSACGLGSVGTDLIVNLVRNEGPLRGLYGARITGGGSGGTVAVLGSAVAGSAILTIAEKYKQETGYQPYIFSGSSSGAAAFGSCRVSL